MASISCSVILMISCFRTVGKKNPAIYLCGSGELPSDREPSPIFQESPVMSLMNTFLFSVLKALCRKSEPTFLSIPCLLSVKLMTPSSKAQPLVMVLWLLSPFPSTSRMQKKQVGCLQQLRSLAHHEYSAQSLYPIPNRFRIFKKHLQTRLFHHLLKSLT